MHNRTAAGRLSPPWRLAALTTWKVAQMWVEAEVDTALVWDAAVCPNPLPDGYAACMGYLGGSSAAHEWTPDEWARVAHMPRLPVWVPTPGTDNPRQSALACLARLDALRVPRADQNGGRHVRILWDLETGREPDKGWADAACDVMRAHGYFSLIYGSAAWTFGNPARAGYVVADPTGQPHMYDHPNVAGTQFAWGIPSNGGRIDASLFTVDTVRDFWQP